MVISLIQTFLYHPNNHYFLVKNPKFRKTCTKWTSQLYILPRAPGYLREDKGFFRVSCRNKEFQGKIAFLGDIFPVFTGFGGKSRLKGWQYLFFPPLGNQETSGSLGRIYTDGPGPGPGQGQNSRTLLEIKIKQREHICRGLRRLNQEHYSHVNQFKAHHNEYHKQSLEG